MAERMHTGLVIRNRDERTIRRPFKDYSLVCLAVEEQSWLKHLFCKQIEERKSIRTYCGPPGCGKGKERDQS